MSREKQLQTIRLQREQLIEELELIYRNAFNRLSQLDLGEGAIARLTQLILNSKEGAITPLKKEIERPLLTKAPQNP